MEMGKVFRTTVENQQKEIGIGGSSILGKLNFRQSEERDKLRYSVV